MQGQSRSISGLSTELIDAPPTSLSRRIFELDWTQYVPVRLDDDVTLSLASVPEALAFVGEHYTRIFGASSQDTRFFSDPATPAKLRFLAESDRFVFRDDGEVIGLLVGQPTDWSTYYWRSVAFLPEHQGRGLLGPALAHTDRVLRTAGVVRVEGEAAPTNYRQVRLLLRLGYCATGTVNSERWGTLLRFTKYLVTEAEDRFMTQFCQAPSLTNRERSVHRMKGVDDEEVCNDDSLRPSRTKSGVFARRIP